MRSRTSCLVAAIALTACGRAADTVDIDTIAPASATNVADVPVQLDGAFALDVMSDLDTGSRSVASFTVAIDDMPLADAAWIDDRRIDATIPAGLAPGRHDVIVTIGSRRGVLVGGFAITGANLTASIAIPPVIGRGSATTVTMTVTNDGVAAATALAPSTLTTTGTATATVVTPPMGGASLAVGASTTFEWTYTTTTIGTLAFTGTATGTDDLTGLTIESAPATSNLANVLEVTTVVGDPLADGSPFGYVAGFAGHVYIGPSRTGDTLARLAPDGTGLESGLTMAFGKDVTGNTASSGASGYSSIGFAGCTADTTCGPDNEDGRGLLTAGTLGGTEWLVLGGARSGGDLDYLYMTSDTGTSLDVRYVDLSLFLGAETRAISAARFVGNRLYLGFADSGGSRPFFVALGVTPQAPGLDATVSDAANLHGDQFPGFTGGTTPAMIDSLGDQNGVVYVANAGGVFASLVATPGPYSLSDWALSTPARTEWTQRASRLPINAANLTPADRAVPQFAAFGGRLFFGRNTTTGPQLWACDPAGSSSPTRCEQGDWQLAAPNIMGDVALTQFNDSGLTSISMVVATPQWLYVGFDSASGVQVFRTNKASSLLPIDFEGFEGCRANMHPTNCDGIGGAGVGDAADTQILDAKALTFGTTSSVWLTVGNGTTPTRVVLIP